MQGAIELFVDENLVGVTNEYGRKLHTYDTGSGHLWLYIEAGGLDAVVRAETWEEAWETIVDEVMDDAEHDASLDDDCVYARGGVPTREDLTSTIAQGDLNGFMLEPLTLALLTERKLRVEILTDDETTYAIIPSGTIERELAAMGTKS